MSAKQGRKSKIRDRAKSTPNDHIPISLRYYTLGKMYDIYEKFVGKRELVVYDTPNDVILLDILERFEELETGKKPSSTEEKLYNDLKKLQEKYNYIDKKKGKNEKNTKA